MKDTLKEDMATKIIQEELVDDNTLLQFVQVTEDSSVLQARVRYITKKGGSSVISEDVIGHITLLGAYIQEDEESKTFYGTNGSALEVSHQGIAYFVSSSTENRNILASVYDVASHQFVENDFKALKYQNFFGKPYGMKQFIRR